MPALPQKGETFVDSFARGLLVIRSFGAGADKQTLSDVARRAEISRASARRLLHTLLQLGYVQYDGKYFSLRPRILDLGYAYISTLEMTGATRETMQDLATRMNSACSITVLDGHDVVYVVRAAVHLLTHRAYPPGTRIPAHCLAGGRIQLAMLDDATLENYLATATLTAFTPYTVTDRDRLRDLILADREKGWSLVARELNEGVCAIAMPIQDSSGKTTCALAVSLRPDLSDDRATIDFARRSLTTAVETLGELFSLRG